MIPLKQLDPWWTERTQQGIRYMPERPRQTIGRADDSGDRSIDDESGLLWRHSPSCVRSGCHLWEEAKPSGAGESKSAVACGDLECLIQFRTGTAILNQWTWWLPKPPRRVEGLMLS